MGAGASKPKKSSAALAIMPASKDPAVKIAPTTAVAINSAPCNDVFSWLSWAPPVGSPCKSALDRCYPGALPGQVILKRTAGALKTRYGMDPQNTIYGQSICPDEINNEKGDLADIMKEYWGEVFPMGGIGGAPYVGKTGFGAFSHHVSDGGHVFILFGPHVAVSKSGEIGKYHRVGQSGESGACGAVIAAYQQCCSGKEMPFEIDDMQQSWLRESIASKIDEIKADPEPIKAVTDVAYEVCKDKVRLVIPPVLALQPGCRITTRHTRVHASTHANDAAACITASTYRESRIWKRQACPGWRHPD